MRSRTYRFAVLLLFLLSGASGLVYQIIWTKELTLIMGVTVYAVSTVLASFMAGLALGSYLFGRLVDKSSRPLLIYALLEGGIGLYALLIPLLFSGVTWVYVQLHGTVGFNLPFLVGLRFVLCFIVLLIPTTLMGGTLPVLSKFFVERERSIGLGVGMLYAVNTTGAVAGCFLTGFFLIPLIGISRTTVVAVAVNLLVALMGLVIYRVSRPAEPAAKPEPSGNSVDPDKARYPPRITRTVFWVIGLSGFASLGYEVLWTRILVYFLGPSTYAFTAMLTTFLVGIALGSWVIARFTDRVGNPVLLFGVIEVGIGLSALAAILYIDKMFLLSGYVKSSTWVGFMASRFFLAFLFMFLPTLFMGASFPLAARIYSRGLDTLGRRVGDVYSINTLLAIFGSAATGFILIPLLGLQRSMVVLVCMNLCLGAVLFIASPKVRGKFKTALVALVMILLFGALTRFENVEVIRSCGLTRGGADDQEYEILYCKEGVDASLAVIKGKRTGVRQLNINGTSTAYADLGDMQVHRLLAHIPMALHPDPKEVLIIGFGFGSTAYGTLQYDVDRVDCAELVDDERETADFFSEQNHGILKTEDRFRFYAEDGRNFVFTTRNRYDVLSLNAIHPSLGPTLYTHDFFKICREKLKPGALACIWLPTTMLATEEYRILFRSFQDVFPYSTFWYNNPGNTILLGSVEDFRIDFDRFRRNLERPGVRTDLEEVNLADPFTFLQLLVWLPDQVAAYVEGAKLNTDDRPWIEFTRSLHGGFREDMLERVFFTEKADIPSFLTSYGATDEDKGAVERRFELYRKAWPYMVEGHLLTIWMPSDVEQESAAWCFRQALLMAPFDLQLRYMAANLGVSPGYHTWRIRQLEKSISKGAASHDEVGKLAKLYLEAGRFEQALALLEGQRKEGGMEHELGLALALQGSGRSDDAVNILRDLCRRYESEAAPAAFLAKLLLLQEDLDRREEALLFAERALELRRTPENLDLMGMALFECGRLEESEKVLEEAVAKAKIVFLTFKYHLSRVRAALTASD